MKEIFISVTYVRNKLMGLAIYYRKLTYKDV